MEGGNSSKPLGSFKREQNIRTKDNNVIVDPKGDNKRYYVFHCNTSIGAIYQGSEFECRAYLLKTPELIKTSIIVDEREYAILANYSEERVRAYFTALANKAKSF